MSDDKHETPLENALSYAAGIIRTATAEDGASICRVGRISYIASHRDIVAAGRYGAIS
jgi:hypothetical protein